MSRGIHVGDIGTVFSLTILDDEDKPMDISEANSIQIIFKKPKGGKFTRSPILVTDGKDGKIKYVTVSGDLDVAGFWSLQGIVQMDENVWRSNVASFRVYSNI